MRKFESDQKELLKTIKTFKAVYVFFEFLINKLRQVFIKVMLFLKFDCIYQITP